LSRQSKKPLSPSAARPTSAAPRHVRAAMALIALVALFGGTALLAGLIAPGREPSFKGDVPYEPTPHAVVKGMIELAEVRSGDVVYDLGCGDGRIVIAAVGRPGVTGVCVEIDPDLLRRSRDNAARAGVAERIRFVEGDLFETPIADATVVALYLWPRVNLRLRPRLLSELRPGTRIVSHSHDMGDWAPERRLVVTTQRKEAVLYRWTIPPR
jgi:SAM-dependent methyltransferase